MASSVQCMRKFALAVLLAVANYFIPFFLALPTGADDVSRTHGLHAGTVTAYIVMIVLIWAAQCWGCLAEQEAYLLQLPPTVQKHAL